jgi:hypothetical protein
MKFIYLFPILILATDLLLGCHQKPIKEDVAQPINTADAIEFRTTNRADNLTIRARFSECGEWGGHEEVIVVHKNRGRDPRATYKVYPFKCDSSDYYYETKNLKPIIDREITLTEKEKQGINNYVQRLAGSK